MGAVSDRPAAILSFDLEDWHQLVQRSLGLGDDGPAGSALERQMEAVLALLDELGASATFFVLGMTARRYPDLVREVAARGYEVACHGEAHQRVYAQTADEFRLDVESCAALVEELAGSRPEGYRAPAFSINRETPWAYDVLCDLGFRYDSSQYDSPVVPKRLGGVPDEPYRLDLGSGRELWEYPVAVWRVAGRVVPVGGGAYWQLLPSSVLLRGLRERAGSYPVLYFHPYECDPLPLRAELPASLPVGTRLRARSRQLRRNVGRRRVVPRIRTMARHFRLVGFKEAHGEVVGRFGTRTRALSGEGVLV